MRTTMQKMDPLDKTPPLYGLVLAGGRSSRMGRDKGLLAYHGLPQREYLYQLLEPLCQKTFLSIRPEQSGSVAGNFETILDEDRFKGPFNGLLSAFHGFPDAAWLVVACDLPLLDAAGLEQLISHRDPAHVGTAYATRASGLPEPLAAIWEPAGLQQAETYLATAESSCPRKFLIRHGAKLVFPANDALLANANDPAEYELIQAKLAAL